MKGAAGPKEEGMAEVVVLVLDKLRLRKIKETA